jgi:hypothetical protein
MTEEKKKPNSAGAVDAPASFGTAPPAHLEPVPDPAGVPEMGTRLVRPSATADKTWTRTCLENHPQWLNECLIKMRIWMVEDKPDEEIAEETGATYQVMDWLRAQIDEQDRKQIDQADPLDHYLGYIRRLQQVVKEINDTIPTIKTGNQHGSLVAAFKLKADIYTQAMEMGMKLGIIEKADRGIQLAGGMNLAGRTAAEVRDLIAVEMAELNRLLKKAGKVG